MAARYVRQRTDRVARRDPHSWLQSYVPKALLGADATRWCTSQMRDPQGAFRPEIL